MQEILRLYHFVCTTESKKCYQKAS